MSGAGRKSGGAGIAKNDGTGAELGAGGRGAGTDDLLTISIVFMIHSDVALVEIC